MNLLVEIWKFAAEYAQINGFGDLAFAIAVVVVPIIAIGLLLGWFIGQRSALANIKKTHAESSKAINESRLKYQELLAVVEGYRDDLNEQKKQLDQLLQEIRDILHRRGVKILRDARDRICLAPSTRTLGGPGSLFLCAHSEATARSRIPRA